MRIFLSGSVSTLVLTLSIAVPAISQQLGNTELTPRQIAQQELETAITESDSLTDKSARVTIKANVARILWTQDGGRARQMLLDLWAWVNSQSDENFNSRSARTELIRVAFSRDRELGTKLLADHQSKTEGSDSESDDLHEAVGIIDSLISSAPDAAATLIETKIAPDNLPAAVPLINRLRLADSAVADALVSRSIEAARLRSNRQALSEVYALIDYMFPTARGMRMSSNDALNRQFFGAASEILARSIKDSEAANPNAPQTQSSTDGFSNFLRAQVAGVLSLMAVRYAPQNAMELKALTTRLLSTVPPPLAEAARAVLARISGVPLESNNQAPEVATANALVNGDFNEARRQLEKVEKTEVKKFFEYQIASEDFRLQVSQSNLLGAMQVARRVEHPSTKLEMFASVALAAKKAHDPQLAFSAIEEARTFLAGSACTKATVAASFLVSSVALQTVSDGGDTLLNEAIRCMNSVSSKKDEKLEQVASLAGDRNLTRVFGELSVIDFERALSLSDTINDRAARLAARLAASEKQLSTAKSTPSEIQPLQGKKRAR